MNAATFLRRRLAGTYQVDPWGLDPDLVELVSPLAGLRWSLEVDGAHQLPPDGPAVVVCNRRFGVSEPLVLAAGLARATGRLVRLVGLPDVAPVGPLLRRLGSTVAVPAEVAGLLRAGQVVGVPLVLEPTTRYRAGWLDPALVTLALEQEAPVFPVAAIGHELGRRWRLIVGPEAGHGAADPAQMVDDVRTAVQALLDGARPARRLWRGWR
ncbi:MAG: hypothetical protein ACRD0A_07805 [Acidimicrobiales bacterium]